MFASQLVPFATDDILRCQARYSSDHARSQSKLAQLGLHRMWEWLSVIVGHRSRRKGKVKWWRSRPFARILAEKTIRTTQGFLLAATR